MVHVRCKHCNRVCEAVRNSDGAWMGVVCPSIVQAMQSLSTTEEEP